VHEIKPDGYRLMVWRDGERVRLFTRCGFDWTDRYPWIEHSARRLPVTRLLIDDQAVVCGQDGVSDFERLHSRQHDATVFLYAFDLLALDGADIRREQLGDWRAKLTACWPRPDGTASPTASTARACSRTPASWIVCKRRDAPYRSGRSKAWVKIKNPASPVMRRLEEAAW
jgi:ATP-dependent DNA ligase